MKRQNVTTLEQELSMLRRFAAGIALRLDLAIVNMHLFSVCREVGTERIAKHPCFRIALSTRFDKALAKIKSWLSARRENEPNAPRVFMTRTFDRLLQNVGKDDRMMADNFIKMLSADPDMPKRGRNVDGTRCHKTDLAKGNRAAIYRVLYYHRKSKNEVYLILLFPKSDQDNLTDEQAKKINYVTHAIENGTIDLTSLDDYAP
ncbi:MAG TPA: hypothetical protein VFH95_05050 [Candidatus Kapabacteria bacterium]|nr:hypothetical protein [Candidatus Kapabacteria bacterium]